MEDIVKGAGYFVVSMIPKRSRPPGSYRQYVGFRRECYGEGFPTRAQTMEYLRWISRERRSWARGGIGS